MCGYKHAPTTSRYSTTTAKSIVASQNAYQIALIGPLSTNVTWQAQANQGYDQSHFTLDRAQQMTTCPNGKQSRLWAEDQAPLGNITIQIRFAAADCADCPDRACCTHSPNALRSRRILPQEEYLALQAARHRQQTPPFRALYDWRAGIEGAFSWAVRSFGLRTSRYIGHAKTHLHDIAVATAMNLPRLADFFAGHEPTPTRLTPLARLAAHHLVTPSPCLTLHPWSAKLQSPLHCSLVLGEWHWYAGRRLGWGCKRELRPRLSQRAAALAMIPGV